MPLDQIIDQVSGMGAMGGKPHTASDEHHPRLLLGYIDPAGAPPPRREVTLPVGAEAAQVAKRGIERLIGLEQSHTPVSKVRDPRQGRGPYRLPQVFGPDNLGGLFGFYRYYHHVPPYVLGDRG